MSPNRHPQTITKRSLIALFVALALSLVQAPALGARKVVIEGGGWGHGIGMSQYGAYGRAKKGATSEKILTTYYTDTKVAKRDMPSQIRVGLLQYQNNITFQSIAGGSGSGKVSWNLGENVNPAVGDPTDSWRVEASDTGGMRLLRNDRKVKRDGRSVFGGDHDPLVLRFAEFGSVIDVAEKSANYGYGTMEVDTFKSNSCGAGHCLRLVVSLPMQKYLYGLAEMPSSWPQAALQSQAIAGRTYVFDKIKRSGQDRYPCSCAVFDSTYDQVYAGEAKKDSYFSSWKQAVDATSREVIVYDGSPIQALYSSSSGGYTEHNENVWGGTPLPYLRGVPDKADGVEANPNHTWTVEMSWRDFGDKLDNAFKIGKLERFKLLEPFGVSGRVTVVKSDDKGGAKIVGSSKTVRVDGWDLRSELGLKDTLFEVHIVYPTAERFRAKRAALDRPTGDALSKAYAVPRGWKRPRGRAQDFERGRMTWNRKTDSIVWQWGPILDAYEATGRERSGLGMPTSGIWEKKGYMRASYTNGLIAYSRGTGARSVKAGFADLLNSMGGIAGKLGLPLTDRRNGSKRHPHGGSSQRFEHGTIYATPKGVLHALWGAFDERFRAIGGAASRCGYPLSNVKDGRVSFQRGKIVRKRSGALAVRC